jgi:hypothetical protein
MTKVVVGKILKTINLVIGAIRPKSVTWSLDKNGTGYEKIENEMDDNFETHLPENAIGSVKTKKETDDEFDMYLTDSGIPWIQSKKETKSKSGIKNQGTENPKFTTKELKREHQTNLETIKNMQESIDLKSKIRKKSVNKSKNKVLDTTHSRFTTEELAREIQTNLETIKKIQESFDLKYKNKVLDIVHCRFTPEELAREKQADVETRRRLKEIIESKFTIDKQIELGHFFDSKKGVKYYHDRYNKEHIFKDWFDTTFPNYTIKEILELAIPCTFSKEQPQSNALDTFDTNKDLQNYIDIYNNDTMYKEWFDRKYPGQSIYEIIGLLVPNS